MPELDPWLTFAERFGFPATVAGAVLYALWKVAKWTGENAIKPLVTSTIELHNTLQRESVEKRIKLAHLEELAEYSQNHSDVTAKQVDEIHRVVVRHQDLSRE